MEEYGTRKGYSLYDIDDSDFRRLISHRITRVSINKEIFYIEFKTVFTQPEGS